MHFSDFMLVACLIILIYINKQLLADTYLTKSKLTINPFQNYVYISKFRKSMSNDIMLHGLDAADWSRA